MSGPEPWSEIERRVEEKGRTYGDLRDRQKWAEKEASTAPGRENAEQRRATIRRLNGAYDNETKQERKARQAAERAARADDNPGLQKLRDLRDNRPDVYDSLPAKLKMQLGFADADRAAADTDS